MATQSVCLYNKFGYCKHKELCRKQHVNGICENVSCEISVCRSRHPKTCKWYREFGKCKFDPCAFKHVENNSVEKLTEENREILYKLSVVEKALKALQEEENEVTESIKKATNEETIKDFKEKLSYQNGVLESFGNKLKEMKEAVEEKDALINNLVEKVKHLEERQECLIEEAKEKFSCNECDFKTYHKTGLKIHKKRCTISNLVISVTKYLPLQEN